MKVTGHAALKKIKKHQQYLERKFDELDAQGDDFSQHHLDRLRKFNTAILETLFSGISKVEK